MVFLKLLGVVSLSHDGRPITGPAAQRRRLALLALLATSRKGGLSRDKLIGYLWPDTESEQARHFLADSIYALRKALGAEAIRAAGNTLELNDDIVRTDARDFRQAIAGRNWQSAVSIYEGPFLDGFVVPEALELDQWIELERAEFAREYANSLEQLARDSETRGEPAQAVQWWRRLQVGDPLNSRTALSLMMALEASGDRSAALAHFRIHESLIRDEFGIEPDPSIVAYADRLRAPSAPSVPLAPAREATPAASVARSEPAPSAPPRVERRPSRAPMLVAATFLVALVVSAAYLSKGPHDAAERVFVTTFENRTGDPALDPLGRMASDWIARGLMQTRGLEVISPTWTIYSGGSGAKRESPALAEQAGARTIVAGAYYLEGNVLRFEAQILSAVRGELLQSLDPVTVAIDSGTAGVDLLRQRITAAVAARFGGPQERREITVRSQPPTYAAYLEYVEGVQQYSHFNSRAAAEHFERAWALDTTFDLARLYGILAVAALDDDARRDSLIESLVRRRDRMPEFDRALLDAFRAAQSGNQSGIVRAMRTVSDMAPGSQFVVGYAVAAVGANRPHEALRALEELDPRAGLVRDYPRYWEWITIARHLIDDHGRELRDARAARAMHPDLPGTRAMEIRALAALGKVVELQTMLDEASSPMQNSAPDLLHVAATELRAHGHAEAAIRFADSELAWYRAHVADTSARSRRAFGRALYEAGKLDEAPTLFAKLAEDQPENVAYLGQLGTIAARRGDRDEAQRVSSALAASTQPRQRGLATLWRARVAALLGDGDGAVELLRSAMSQGVGHGIWLHADPDFFSLRSNRAFRELLRPLD